MADSLVLWAADDAEVGDGGILLTRSQLEQWAGVSLTDADLARLADTIPGSIIPRVVWAIINVG